MNNRKISKKQLNNNSYLNNLSSIHQSVNEEIEENLKTKYLDRDVLKKKTNEELIDICLRIQDECIMLRALAKGGDLGVKELSKNLQNIENTNKENNLNKALGKLKNNKKRDLYMKAGEYLFRNTNKGKKLPSKEQIKRYCSVNHPVDFPQRYRDKYSPIGSFNDYHKEFREKFLPLVEK